MCISEGHLEGACCVRVTLVTAIGEDSLMMIAEIYLEDFKAFQICHWQKSEILTIQSVGIRPKKNTKTKT